MPAIVTSGSFSMIESFLQEQENFLFKIGDFCFIVYFVLNLFFYYSFRIDDDDKVWIKVFYNNQTERKFSKNEMV